MIKNVQVYGLKESIKASKYPKAIDVNRTNETITNTTINLGHAERGSGHDCYLKGIVVQFDLEFTIKAWTEAERYHFFEIISSQSTMHCISKFLIKNHCNQYVSPTIIAEVERLKKNYLENPTPENYLKLLYNVPVGFKLTARISTSYLQLKTIYYQRKDHRLPEWKEFCKWIENLPYFKALILDEKHDIKKLSK